MTDEPSSVAGPLNIRVMDVDAFLRTRDAQRVTSLMIREPSSPDFHPDGLFSETIFGQIGSPDRLITFGYLELNCKIIAPVLYKNLMKLSADYRDLLAGRRFATWNASTLSFDMVQGDPEDVEGANTGFSFFLEHFPQMEFASSDSDIRENRIELLTKYRMIGVYERVVVSPAGTRDVEQDGGRMTQDDVNRLYSGLLMLTSAIPPGATSPLYDGVRYQIQEKVVEIYEYFENFMTGKRGFLQGAFGSRKVALGTRNVISAASYATLTPDHPQALHPDETKVGLFQTMKALTPLVTYFMRTAVLDPIFGSGDAATFPLINPKTLELEYRELPALEVAKFVGPQAVETWINRFRNPEVRELPLQVRDVGGKPYYLCMIYDTGDEVALFRSIADLEAAYSRGPINKKWIRPLTWVEIFYMATYNASQGKHIFITRYPVIQDASCYPSRIHLCTTAPSRVVRLLDLLSGHQVREYPEFPILGNPYIDTIVPHSSRLAGLGGDFDGDMVSSNAVLSDEANLEAAEYLNSPKSLLDAQKRFVSGGLTDLSAFMFHAMTHA